MPITLETSEGPLVVSDTHIRAIARHAERRADLTAAFLDAVGLPPKKTPPFPAAFLLELSAVLELGLWERRGLTPLLPADLPTYSEAAQALLERAQKGPNAFKDSDGVSLASRVLKVWVDHFAWEGPDLLNAEFVVSNIDEDQFADVLADFIWRHRRELSGLLTNHNEH